MSGLPLARAAQHPDRPLGAARRIVARFAAFATAVALVTISTATTAPAEAATPTCATANITVTGLGGPNFYIDGSSTPEFKSGYTGYRVTNATGAAMDDLWVSLSGFTGGRLALASGQSAAQRLGSLTSGGGKALFWYLTATGESLTAQGHTITVHNHNPALANSSALCTTTGGFAAVEGTISANANKVDGITVTGGTPALGSTFTVTVTGDTGQIGDGTTLDPESLWMTPAVTEAWPADAFRLVGTALRMSPDGTAAQQTYTDTLRVANLGPKARPYTAEYTFQAVGFTASPTPVRPVQEIASGTQVKHTGDYPASLPEIAKPVNNLTVALASPTARLDSNGGTVTFTSTVSGTVGASLDSFVLTPPAGTLPVASSVTWAGVAAQDPVWRNGTLVFPGPFTVPATGAQLTFTVTVDGDPGGQAFSLLGVVGPSFIGRTVTPVDGSNPATASVTVDTDPVAGAFSVLVDQDVPKTISLSGHVSDADNDTITLSSAQGASHGTVSVVAGAMLYTPAAGYVGPDSFTYTVSDGRGGTATATVTVTVAAAVTPPAPNAQTITFAPPGDLTTGDTATLTASADSGLTVTLTSQTPGVCTITTGIVTAVAAGTCTIAATQAGNATYAAASPVSHSLTVNNPPTEPHPPTAQVIAFAQPSDLVTGDTATATATASSNLAVTLTSQTTSICTVVDGVVTAVTAGTCTIDATQAGNATYAAASPVTRALTVKDPQTITFAQPDDLVPGDTASLNATTSSNLAVSLSSQTAAVCTITGGVVTAVSAGTCTIRATQAGNATYAAATPVTRSLAVTDTQVITFHAAALVLTGPPPLQLTASSSSGLPVSLTLVAGSCTLHGRLLVADRDTTCTVEATQAGDALVAPAAPVRQQISFVSPQDDASTMESPFVGADHVDVRPLANDPSGLAITSVGQPTHGTVSVDEDGAVRYAPYSTFHGTDSFTYAVADGDGRSATAVVRVTVANAAPVVTAERVRQLAGTTISVPMSAADPNEDALVLTAKSQGAGVGVAVDGTDLTINAGRRITGWVAVHVDVTDAFGATGSTTVRDLVSPMPVDSASRTIAAEGTRVRWSRADADDARYEVLVDGQTACTTRTLSCDLDRVLGPLFRVQVRVLGHDGTTSTRTDARPEGHQQVLIATVYFDSGRWQLSDAQTRELASVARKITRMRFPLAQVSGYTDSDGGAAYNLRLSRQRTRTVSAYLRGHAAITSREAWFGYDDPVAENTSAAGRARNRRVEILVRY